MLRPEPKLEAYQISELQSQFLQVRRRIFQLLNERKEGNKNRNKFFKTGVADYNSLGSNVDEGISRLEHKSRELLFRISEGKGFKDLDLHQLTLDEAIAVVDKVVEHLEDLMERESCRR